MLELGCICQGNGPSWFRSTLLVRRGDRRAVHQRCEDIAGLSAIKPVFEFPDDAVPVHVAVIMDGNGRWAQARKLERAIGHLEGVDAARRAVRAAIEIGVPYLTLFGFSAENWKRPAHEIDALMRLLRHYLRDEEVSELRREGVRILFIGDRARFAEEIVTLVEAAERRTRGNTRLTLTIAFDYGGRQEIVRAARSLARRAATGEIDPEVIDEAALGHELFTANIPDPDLVIRTSGEQRISNFMLWQCAYAELVFLDTLWPDFSREDFIAAVREFQRRVRRFERTTIARGSGESLK